MFNQKPSKKELIERAFTKGTPENEKLNSGMNLAGAGAGIVLALVSLFRGGQEAKNAISQCKKAFRK